MKYVITGNKGLIGKVLHQRLQEDGHEPVLAIDKRAGKDIIYLKNISPERKADMMFHLASHCKIQQGTDNPELPFRNNVMGAHNVLEFCRKNNISKLVAMSSSRVLHNKDNPYTASKRYLEHLTKAYHDCFGLEFVLIRPSTVYGPGKDETGRLLTNWCKLALQYKELPIFGDGEKSLDFTHVKDFIDGTMLLVDNWEKAKNDTYDISGNDVVKLTNVAKMIGKEVGQVKYGFYPPEVAQPQQVVVDTSKIRRFGYEPKIKLEEGIKEIVNWYKANGTK